MKFIEKFGLNKTKFLSLSLLLVVMFIYGCQCEGSIGNTAKNSETVQVNNAQK